LSRARPPSAVGLSVVFHHRHRRNCCVRASSRKIHNIRLSASPAASLTAPVTSSPSDKLKKYCWASPPRPRFRTEESLTADFDDFVSVSRPRRSRTSPDLSIQFGKSQATLASRERNDSGWLEGAISQCWSARMSCCFPSAVPTSNWGSCLIFPRRSAATSSPDSSPSPWMVGMGNWAAALE